MTAEQIRLAMENKLEYLMEVKPQLASDDQLYKAAALVLRDLMVEKRRAHRAKTTAERKKRIHYLSMEFLMGKSLKNSLYNLGLVEPFTEALTAFGTTPERLFACEPDPGLGNGGLGRLAACYLDGMATDGYYGTGYSILYEYGIFKQKLVNGAQTELPDYWLPGGEVWLRPNEEHAVQVKFGGRLEEHWDQGHLMQQYIDYETVLAVPYNMYVSGYDTEAVSVLRLWKAKSPGIDMECFNNGDYLGAFRKTARAEADGLCSDYLNENDRVFFVSQGDNGEHWFSAVFDFYPVLVDYSGVGATQEGGGGTFGLPELEPQEEGVKQRYYHPYTAERLDETVRANGCTVLYLQKIDDIFVQSYQNLFTDHLAAAQAGQTLLYRVTDAGYEPVTMQMSKEAAQ